MDRYQTIHDMVLVEKRDKTFHFRKLMVSYQQDCANKKLVNILTGLLDKKD